jgi:hypothetical protein
VGCGQTDQAVAGALFRVYAGSGLTSQRLRVSSPRPSASGWRGSSRH